MRVLFIIGVIGVIAWYVFIEGSSIAESDVRGLYSTYSVAFQGGDVEAVCDLFDASFTSIVRTRTPAGVVEENGDRSKACEDTDKFHEMKRAMEEKTGMELFINSEYTVHDIAIDADGKVATAQLSTEIRIGTEQQLLLKMKATQTDTIARSFGKSRFVSSDAEVSL